MNYEEFNSEEFNEKVFGRVSTEQAAAFKEAITSPTYADTAPPLRFAERDELADYVPLPNIDTPEDFRRAVTGESEPSELDRKRGQVLAGKITEEEFRLAEQEHWLAGVRAKYGMDESSSIGGPNENITEVVPRQAN